VRVQAGRYLAAPCSFRSFAAISVVFAADTTGTPAGRKQWRPVMRNARRAIRELALHWRRKGQAAGRDRGGVLKMF